ncbi:hypothetical protein L7F22_042805 [Adiantum nelumboides]|nr:hypothetical protein [Adiantum nelumboides]
MEISSCFKNEYLTDKDFGDAFRALKSLNPTIAEMNMFASYTVMDELLYYLDRICVPHNGALRKILIQEHHEVPFAAHPGINKTYRLLSAIYFWPQIQQDVIKYVKACHSCQIMKASRQLSQGLLQPLPVPKERWESISMDFITTLLRTSKGNAQILVIVDRFSKMAHFIPCKKAASAPDIASLFVQHIFRIHGLPRSIISDRDPKFTGHFWTSLFKSLGTNLLFSSAYHPQTDGQTERVNQILEEMLRHYIQNRLASWEEYLPLVEFAYNNAPHSVTGMTPFQAAYGHTPLVPTNFVLQHKVALADQLVQKMQDILVQVRDKLIHVQQKYQKQANKHRRHAEFNEGDMVLLYVASHRYKTVKSVLGWRARVQIFREFVRSDKTARKMVMGPGPACITVAVRRDHLVEDAFAQLNSLGSELKSGINVSFVNELGLSEAGLDYGGLFKEFLTDLAKAAFDPGYGLFAQRETDEGLLFPHSAAGKLQHGLQMLEFLGRIVGKAIYEGILLEFQFSHAFIWKLLGRYVFFDELSALDPELHQNLLYLKHYDGDAVDLALDFTVTEELFGKRKVIELKPGGAHIQVTNENKLQYVYAMADYKLNKQMQPLICAFAGGLSDIICPAWLSLFNARELNQLISGGEHDFDVDDLKANTKYTGGFTENSRTVKQFWEVLREFEPEERCAFLKFVTSCSRAPLLGFKHLQPAFTIHKVSCDTTVWAMLGGQDVDRLPSASTCYNTLKLPTYKRMSTLKSKLRYAIHSNAGFELS